jgi:VanZ family protein
VVAVVTSIPNPAVPEVVSKLDKLVHFSLYSVLGFLAARAVLDFPSGVRSIVLLVAAIALFAAADEAHQHWIPGRSADPADWVADVLGAGTGIATAIIRLRRKRALIS